VVSKNSIPSLTVWTLKVDIKVIRVVLVTVIIIIVINIIEFLDANDCNRGWREIKYLPR